MTAACLAVLCFSLLTVTHGIALGRGAASRELLDHTEIHNIETLKDIREFERQQRLALIKKYNDTTDAQPGEDLATRLALNEMFWATSGYEWVSHLREAGQEWRKPSNYCTWYGCTCDDYGVLRQVHLSSNNLIGTVPAQVAKLTTLTELFLDHNEALSGTVPDMVNMSELVYLDLSGTELTGTPDGITAALTSLNWIDVSLNKDNFIPISTADPAKAVSERSAAWGAPAHSYGKLTIWEGTGTYWHKPNVTHLMQPFMPDRWGRLETRNVSLGDILDMNKTSAADAYQESSRNTGRG